MFKLARKIASEAHAGQLRKESCVPYITHPLRVSSAFNDDVKKSIAILHDVLEDSSFTEKDLKMWGISKKIIDIVKILSKKKNEHYFVYIARIKQNEIATEIKIADIVDNLSDCISIQPQSRIDRYNRALKILLS